jgi:hypothetical protein
MYAPHFAVALAVKSRERRAPIGALVAGAFLPDLVWMCLARAGIEPAQTATFFDDWSHSLLSIAMLATLFACFFYRKGKAVVLAIWASVFSHFLLDLPLHPKKLALYPKSPIHLGWTFLVSWGPASGWLGAINDWWVQLTVLLVLLVFYVESMRARKARMRVILTPCVLLLGLQALMLAPCIGY